MINVDFFSSALTHAISWTLIHSVWQLLFIGLILFIVRMLIQPNDHTKKYYSALIGLFTSFTVCIATFAYYFSSFNFQEEGTLLSQVALESTIGIETTYPIVAQSYSESILNLFNNNHQIIASLWLLGACFLFVRFIIGIFQTKVLKYHSLPLRDVTVYDTFQSIKEKLQVNKWVEIAESNKINTAMVVGFWQPVILFPIGMINGLTIEELTAILAHELAHIKRNDFLVNLFQTFTELLMYYHPVIWWMSNIINEEREICCDDLALDITKDHCSYAKTLVKLQEFKINKEVSLAMSFSGKNNQFKNRILHILNTPLPKKLNKERSIAFMSVLLLAFAFTNVSFPKNIENECTDLEEECEVSSCDQICVPKDFLEQTWTVTKEEKSFLVLEKAKKCCSNPITKEVRTIKLTDNTSHEITLDVPCCSGTKTCLPRKLDKDIDIRIYSIYDTIPAAEKRPYKITEKNWTRTDSLFSILKSKSNGINIDSLIQSISKTKSLELDSIFDFPMKFSEGNAIIVPPSKQYKFDTKIDNSANVFNLKNEKPSCSPKLSSGNLSDVIAIELAKDGLIDSGQDIKLELTYKLLKINGEKQPKTIWNKYKKIYEDRVGFPLNKNSKIFIETTAEESMNHFKTI